MEKRLNANQIKLIAIVAMTIDHLTWAFFPGTQAVWYIFALYIIGRLFLFAVISHFTYDFAFGIPFLPLFTGAFNQTSVMWSLAWTAVLICICNQDRIPQWVKTLSIIAICLISFPSDWSSIAVMCPFFLYTHRGKFKLQAKDIVLWSFIYAAVYFLFLDKLYGVLQMFTFLTIPILTQYNGERGKWKGMVFLCVLPSALGDNRNYQNCAARQHFHYILKAGDG